MPPLSVSILLSELLVINSVRGISCGGLPQAVDLSPGGMYRTYRAYHEDILFVSGHTASI